MAAYRKGRGTRYEYYLGTGVPFALGTADGCTAEMQATAALLDELEKAAGLLVLWACGNGTVEPVAIPLDGYKTAVTGEAAIGFQAHARRRVDARQYWKKSQFDSCLTFLSESGLSLFCG